MFPMRRKWGIGKYEEYREVNYCVLSGYGYYGNMDDIFYIKNININNTAYVTVMFDYPAESRKECDAILTEFLDNLSYDAS